MNYAWKWIVVLAAAVCGIEGVLVAQQFEQEAVTAIGSRGEIESNGQWHKGVVLTSPGRLVIGAGGKLTHINVNNGDAETARSWETSKDFDGIVVTFGDRTWHIWQYWSDNQGLYVSQNGVWFAGRKKE